MSTKVAIITLGCARNEVDSEEIAAQLSSSGIDLVQEPDQADAVFVNTCGFIETAKKDSIDTLLAANDLKKQSNVKAVVAVGCMAERYGEELEKSLPEADAILGFDDYSDIAQKLNQILKGNKPKAPVAQDRRLLLPISPSQRTQKTTKKFNRFRLDEKFVAPLKLASGCDRRCTFCAIPRFRGAYLSRKPTEILEEAMWLAENGVKELFLVSENTTSYGKDLGDIRLLETLLPEIAKISDISWIRLSYLQPAEIRSTLIESILNTPKVVPYFDISFQHAHPDVLRRMKRFGSTKEFLNLIENIRKINPEAGIRSNFIVGFPGETQEEFEEIKLFLEQAQLDAIGIFGYSKEDGTEAIDFQNQIDEQVIKERVSELTEIAEDLMSQKAHSRIGSSSQLLVESIDEDEITGRIQQQGPETDGISYINDKNIKLGDILEVEIVGSNGSDLEVKRK
ncbi:MAG: ribosomal protein methylthiotransferase RimO [Actinomycetota bacterium]